MSSVTPYCKKILKIYGAAPAAANITLLFPEQSTSYQCRPALSKISVTARWFLNLAQCKGLGLSYLVDPIGTCRFYNFTSRYCCPAPFDRRSFTIEVYPEQHAQINAFHFFLVFSTRYKLKSYLHTRYQPSFLGTFIPLIFSSFLLRQ